MLSRILLIIIGILISAYGLTFMIIYLNLINVGYTYSEYFQLICTRYECISFILGIMLIEIAFIRKKGKN